MTVLVYKRPLVFMDFSLAIVAIVCMQRIILTSYFERKKPLIGLFAVSDRVLLESTVFCVIYLLSSCVIMLIFSSVKSLNYERYRLVGHAKIER